MVTTSDVGSPTGRNNSTQKSGNGKFQGHGQSVSSSTSSLATTGRESGRPKSQRHSSRYSAAEVRTKYEIVTMYIQKPVVPLNAKDRPHVIIKRSDGSFEMGTLMYIGMINQKEMAGVHLDVRMPSMLLERCIVSKYLHCYVFLFFRVIQYLVGFSQIQRIQYWVVYSQIQRQYM